VRKYIVKIIIFLAMVLIYNFIMAAAGPEIAIQASLSQMEDSYSSMSIPLWYNFLKTYQWVFSLGFVSIVFYGEIKTYLKKIVNFLKEKTDEKN
jgi:hypothetical protein